MKYISTRDVSVSLKGSEAIVKGISKDGGLFVPSFFPCISKDDIVNLSKKTYEQRAAFVLHKFLDDFTYDELLDYTTKAYSKFSDSSFPLHQLDNNQFVLELWHGPTSAFKDAALALLPYLMVASKKKINENSRTLILVATSGDTGKAALEGFKNVDGTNIIVFYPSDGVSQMQKLQMMTQEGGNVFVSAINGNFDDAQTAVKEMFNDKDLNEYLAAKNVKLSSANSINWGRLVPQVVYYVSSYVNLVAVGKIKNGEKVNFCVPTGNFGNILAAYYAMKMGIPVNKLICASNKNNILTDFFSTGKYDVKRTFYKTMSPSMDILVSSNLERLLFEMSGCNADFVKEKMLSLKNDGEYYIDAKDLGNIDRVFVGGSATEEETLNTIKKYQREYQYLLDTHTAVGVCVYDKYKKEIGDNTVTVIASTANPYKFPCDVYKGVSGIYEEDAFKATEDLLNTTGFAIPKPLLGLENKNIVFKGVVEKKDIKNVILNYVDSIKG